MKRFLLILVSLLCVLMMITAAGADKATPSANGALQVIGTQLCDANGEPVQLRGMSTHGLAWFPQYVNEACFRELSDSIGCNAVRLAMYTYEYGGYCNGGDQQKLKQLVLNGVNYAKAADMYVIVDWHILYDKDPNVYIEDAVAFFDTMSAMLAGEEHVLYEICNEPNSGTTWAQIRTYAMRVIPVIRANDPDAVILVGTPNWSQSVLDAAADPLPFDNVMYSLHFYSATHGEWLRNNMISALEQGLPIFVTEYGVCSADGNGRYDFEQANVWADLLDEHNVSYMMWSLANSDELCAFLNTSCKKTSGFTAADLTDGGRWLADRLGGSIMNNAAVGAPTAAPAVESADLCARAGFGSWVDTGSGASALVSWFSNDCTVQVNASGANRWYVQPSCGNLKLEQGKTYELTFTLSCTEPIVFDVYLQRNYGDYSSYAGLEDETAESETKAYTLTFTMTEATDSSVALTFNVGGNGSLAYQVKIGDVTLIEK